jgi:hypothetical protein
LFEKFNRTLIVGRRDGENSTQADQAQILGFIHESEHEFGILGDEVSKNQSRGFEYLHSISACIGGNRTCLRPET